MRMYFNEDIDISKIKTWKDVQNLRRGSENDFKELRDTFGYTGNKVNERIAELIFQYNEKVRLRREFYEGKSVDKNLILGTADSKKVDQIDKEMEDSAKKAQETRHAYLNSKEFDEERARFRKEAEEEAEAKEKAEKEKEEELKKAEEEAKEKAKAEMAALVGGKNNVYKDASKGNNNNTSSTSTSTGKYNNPEPVKTPPKNQRSKNVIKVFLN